MFPLLQCLLKWSYLKGSGTLLRIAEGIKKHTLEGWVGLPIAKLLERNKVKRLSLFGSFLAFEKRTPPNEGGRNLQATFVFFSSSTSSTSSLIFRCWAMNLLPLIASANTVNKNLGSSFIALHHDFK